LVKHETGVAAGSVISEKLESPLQGQGVVDGGSILKAADKKAQASAGTEAGLIYKSFDWVSSWSSSAAWAHHVGRASLAYLQGHLDDEAVHVVMG
jgi:hypothetical protein